MMAAVLNAISDESTACEAPSLTQQRTPTTGKPMSVPLRMPSRKPLSQEPMYSRGMEPPVTSSTNSYVSTASAGRGSM